MNSSWLRPVEQIMLAAVDSRSRVVGVASPECGAGVSTLCRMVAHSHVGAGSKTLLVDFSKQIDRRFDDKGWGPGDGTSQLIQWAPEGYGLLEATPTIKSRSSFNNVDALRRMFTEDLSQFDAIVVDLPPLLGKEEEFINPLASARACDAVMMICLPGRTTHRQVMDAMSGLKTAGVQLGGTVLNDYQNPTLGTELASEVRRFASIAPRWSASLQRWLLTNEFLNSRK